MQEPQNQSIQKPDVKDLSAKQESWLAKYGLDEPTWMALTNSVYVGAKPESILMAVQYCRARKLDVLKKPVHIVPMNVKKAGTDAYEWRDVIMPGIYDLRTTAFKTGQYAGQEEPVFGPMVELQFGKSKHTAPEWCKVIVYRLIDGIRCPFAHTEYFEEAASTKKDGDLNSMWEKRKRGQLSKCAEAGALRKAFPDELGGIYSADEMEGKTISSIDNDTIIPDPVLSINQTDLTLLIEKIGDDADAKSLLLSGFKVGSLEEIPAEKAIIALARIDQYNTAKGAK